MDFDAAFARDGTHGLITRPTCSIFLNSADRGWKYLFLSHQREQPFCAEVDALPDHHLIVLHLSGTVNVTGLMESKAKTKMVTPGGMSYWPAGRSFGVDLGGEIDSIHLYLPHSLVQQALIGLNIPNWNSRTLAPIFGERDPLLEQLLIGAWKTAESGYENSMLYADHLALAIGTRLVWLDGRGDERQERSVHKGLDTSQLRRLEEFVEANLHGSIRLSALSGLVCLSDSHFSRKFKHATRSSPHQFIMERRLERAKRLLRNTNESIAQIAFDCGFSHQEHLTRAFRRSTGFTPASYRKIRNSSD